MSPRIREHKKEGGDTIKLLCPRKNRLLLWIYQVLLLVFGLAYLLLRLVKGRGLPGLNQRLARYSPQIVEALGRLRRPIWLHMVSVGEVLAASSLIDQLRRRFPDRDWIFTTVTPTGQELARKLATSRDVLLYLPWDFGPIVAKAVRAFQPSAFLALETEIWPVLFDRLNRQRIPIALVNGRISPRAYPRYLWARPFIARVLAQVSFFLTQSPQDARRFAALGAPKDRIVVSGNIKWDLESTDGSGAPSSDELRRLLNVSAQAILWTAGSTHAGEERLVLAAYRRLKDQYPHLRLLIAPRHPERVAQVEQEVAEAGFPCARRSTLLFNKGSDPFWEPVILLDTMGELKSFYAASDVVFVGGSLVPHGGHNLMEPAAFCRPILTGPHLANFQAVAESLMQAGGVALVKSLPEMENALRHLIAYPQAREELGNRAFGVIRQHRGATQRAVEILERLIR